MNICSRCSTLFETFSINPCSVEFTGTVLLSDGNQVGLFPNAQPGELPICYTEPIHSKDIALFLSLALFPLLSSLSLFLFKFDLFPATVSHLGAVTTHQISMPKLDGWQLGVRNVKTNIAKSIAMCCRRHRTVETDQHSPLLKWNFKWQSIFHARQYTLIDLNNASFCRQLFCLSQETL